MMLRQSTICMAAGAALLLVSAAHAEDARCAVPPYGGTVAGFQSFVKNLGQLVTPSKYLPSICQIKYGGADRTPMYNLGFTDRDIDEKPVDDLWVEVLVALRQMVRQAK